MLQLFVILPRELAAGAAPQKGLVASMMVMVMAMPMPMPMLRCAALEIGRVVRAARAVVYRDLRIDA
jgi:hypothetical protein